jgi:hypothetical protein
MRKMPLFSAVHAAHLLQANNVGIELLDRMAQIVNFQTPGRPQALDTLVDL